MLEKNVLQLINQYEQQIILYKEMLTIVQNQHLLCSEADFMNDLTREEDLNQLNQLLFKRQKKMDLVEANQEKAQAIKKNLQVQLDRKELNIKALSRHFPSPQTYRLLEKIKEIEALLKEIAELDQKTQKLFLVKLNLARQELGKVKKRKKINKLYNPDDLQREGFFIDYNK